MGTMKKLQETHDLLVASRPEGDSCPEGCPFCSGEFASWIEEDNSVSDKTFTEEELSAAVAKATEDLRSEITALKAQDEDAAQQAKIDEAVADVQAQVAELTTKLDAAVIEAETAKTERDELNAWLQAESDRVVAEAEAATRRVDRISKVGEVIKFPEEHVEARADGWAAQSDEQFEATLADYRVLAASQSAESGLPRFTAMQASRDSSDDSVVGSGLRELIRNRSLDPRAIR